MCGVAILGLGGGHYIVGEVLVHKKVDVVQQDSIFPAWLQLVSGLGTD